MHKQSFSPIRRWHKGELQLNLEVRPKSAANELRGISCDNERLVVGVKAPPVDGKANAAMIKLLARKFKVRQQDVTVLQGKRHKHKLVSIMNAHKIPDDLAVLLGVKP